MSAPDAASQTLPIRNCYWAVPGLLLAGEHPNGSTRDKTKDRLKKLLAAGIECFVDLTKPTEVLRYDTLLPFYVEYTRKSIKDHSTPGARAEMVEILEYIANAMRAGRPVYVHCRAGIGRTGTVVGCLLVERGLRGNAAIDELNRLWQQCRRSRSWPTIPETDPQAQYVRGWQPSLGSGFELSSLATAVATVGSMSTDGGVRSHSGAAGVARAGAGAQSAGVGRTGAAGDPAGVGSGSGANDRAAGRESGKGGSAAGRPGAGAAPTGVGRPDAGRSGGTHAGLRAAAEQARAAVERGEVQVKAPPVPVATGSKPGGGVAMRGKSSANDARAGLERGEIASSIRTEVSEAITGRSPALTSHGTAAPNGGEEAPWVAPGNGNGDTSVAGGFGTLAQPRANVRDAALVEADVFKAEPLSRPVGFVARPEPLPSIDGRSPGVGPSTGFVPDAGLGPASTSAEARAPAEELDDYDPLLDPNTLAAARGLRERFVGTLFGLAAGDAVAATTQFRRPGTFTPIGDMLGGGPFDLPRGAWSDDTAMALCLAESLVEREGFDARDQVQRYSRWQQDGYLTSTGQCVGITASTARALSLAKWRRGMVFPGSHDPEQLDPEPLSRIAGVALFYFASLEMTLQQAVDSSRVTCQAPAVLDACRRLARALHAALSGQPKAKILADVGPITEAAAQANSTAAAALNAAFWAFSSTDNFRDAVLRAANVGGNSDVVAAVCGQLAGAHYGATAIPHSWRNGLMEKDLIEGIADRLLTHALVSLSS